MNRFSKILATVLLIALCLSTLGIFSVFAEDATTLAPTVVIDMNSYGESRAVTHAATITNEDGTTGKAVTFTKEADDNGDVYWLLQSHVKAGESLNNGEGAYVSDLSPKKGTSVVVKSGGTKGDKNTDFMVIDLDIATDDTFIDYLQFHMRYGNSTGAISQDGNGYPQIKGYGYDDLYLAMSKKSGYELFPLNDLEDEWVNVTFVYDFRGETASAWKAHAYIDGYYVGSFASATKSDAYYLQWLRLSIPATATADYQSTKIRNLTYTTYPVGWTGDLTDTAALGSYGNTLYDIEELAYCLEGTNAKRDDVIATVTRGTETIDIKDFDDLDANFQNGDVVDLKANINTPLLVNAENVTFNDNGYRYSKVDTTEVDFSVAKYVILDRITRAVVASGDAAAFAELALTDGTIIVLLDDLTRTVAGSYAYARNTTFDINGHFMTLAAAGRAFDTNKGSDGILRFKDGELKYAGKTDLTMMSQDNAIVFEQVDFTVTNGTLIDQRNGLVLFKDSNVKAPNYGTAKEPAYSLITSLKGSSSVQSGLYVVNSDVTCDGNSFATMANLSTSSHRYGGLNANVRIEGSEISAPEKSVFYFEAYCNQTLYINEEGTVTTSFTNKFNVDFDVVNSKVSTDYRFVDAYLMSLSYTMAKTTYNYTDEDGDGTPDKAAWITLETPYEANDMDINVGINLAGSEIICSSVVNQQKSSTLTYEDVTYAFDADVAADAASKIKASIGVMWNQVAEDAVNSSLTLANGVLLANDRLTRSYSAQAIDKVTLGEGDSVAAYTSKGENGYNCIVTDNYVDASYAIERAGATLKKEAFYWVDDAEDAIDIEIVAPIPEATTEYSYTEWVANGNDYVTELVPEIKLSANLTALSDFDLNVYLSAGVNTDKITMTVDGNKVADFQAINIAGVDYLKAEDQVIKGITPELVEGEHVVVVSFVGGFGENVELTANVSAAKHLTKALDGATDEGKAFAQAIINYVAAANAYEGKTVAIFEGKTTEVAAPDYSGAKWDGALTGVTAELNLGDSVRWVFSTESTDTFTVTYAGGTRKFTAEDGEITIGVRAINLLNDITITNDRTGETLTFNLAGYHNKLTDAKAQAVVDAMYQYSVAAKAYAGK